MKGKMIRQTVLPLIAAFIWGSAFVAQYLGSDNMPAYAFVTVRNFIAIWFLALVVLMFDIIRRKNPSFDESYVNDNKELVKGGLLCGLSLGIAMNLQQFGVEGSGAGKSGFITTLYVAFIPIIGLFLKKKQPLKIWISVAISIIGLYLLCIDEKFTIVASDVYLLACAFSFAVQMMITSHFVQKVDAIRLSCLQFAVAAVVSAVFMIAFKQYPTLEMIKASIGPLLYTAILSSGVAYTLQIFAQRGTNVSVVSLIMCLESVFATICGAIILNEKMTAREYFGCAIMFCAVIISQLFSNKEIEKE
ncbi:MAG: DMT family transporter [Clostridia bacterium]|nr:DMT family transporter [Clostridia bacterium]